MLAIENEAETIEFDDLTHRYGRNGPLVLDGFTWRVPAGRTVLLGPNGAGKTTLLSIGASAISLRRGRVKLGNLDPAHHRDRGAYRRAVGWMPQSIKAIPGLTCREQVAYMGWLKGLSTRESWKRSSSALELVDLLGHADSTAANLSGGQLQRLGLAQCLVHDAESLLLDEPTAGLDPEQRARFREVLVNLPAKSIVVATHQVDDIADVFESVGVIDSGVIVWEGKPEAFLALAPAGSRYPGEDAFRQILAAAS